ncbi:MAG TPA: DUF2752 domain-containing protein [Ignavibacteria bacterium]|nr:DUF2752 domain-containing protein [Ignavibacteria bacterium]
MNKTFISDIKFSFRIVWIIFSVLIFVVIILSIFSPELLLSISPVCVSKSLYGRECFMCGTTRAFTEITSGNISAAYELNKFSVILFSLFSVNTLLFLIVIVKSLFVRVLRKR